MAIALALLLISMKSFSQNTHFDLLINSVYTNFDYGKSNDQIKSYKQAARGIEAGVSFEADISTHVSVLSEAYFTMKGAVLKTNNPLTTNKSKLRLYSTELPVLARFHLGNFYVNTGPYLGYIISGKLKTKGSESISASTRSISFNDELGGFKRWDMGFQAGIGYNLQLKKSIMAFDFRYGYGLINMSQDDERYNRMFKFSLTIFKPWRKNHEASTQEPFDHF